MNKIRRNDVIDDAVNGSGSEVETLGQCCKGLLGEVEYSLGSSVARNIGASRSGSVFLEYVSKFYEKSPQGLT